MRLSAENTLSALTDAGDKEAALSVFASLTKSEIRQGWRIISARWSHRWPWAGSDGWGFDQVEIAIDAIDVPNGLDTTALLFQRSVFHGEQGDARCDCARRGFGAFPGGHHPLGCVGPFPGLA